VSWRSNRNLRFFSDHLTKRLTYDTKQTKANATQKSSTWRAHQGSNSPALRNTKIYSCIHTTSREVLSMTKRNEINKISLFFLTYFILTVYWNNLFPSGSPNKSLYVCIIVKMRAMFFCFVPNWPGHSNNVWGGVKVIHTAVSCHVTLFSLAPVYQTTRRHIYQDSSVHSLHRKILKEENYDGVYYATFYDLQLLLFLS
jgi:hypothetical protein